MTVRVWASGWDNTFLSVARRRLLCGGANYAVVA